MWASEAHQQSTHCRTLSHCKSDPHTAALQIQHYRTTICKCIHSPLGGEFHRRVAATINEMPVFLLSGPFSDTSCNHTACDHWVTTRGNWQVSGRSSCFVLIQICQNIQRQFVAVLPIAATNRMSVELLNTEAKAHSHRPSKKTVDEHFTLLSQFPTFVHFISFPYLVGGSHEILKVKAKLF